MSETCTDKQGRKRFKETNQLVSELLKEHKITRGSKKEERELEEKKRPEQLKSSNRFPFRTKKDLKKHDGDVEFA